jgi:hypothetical protein
MNCGYNAISSVTALRAITGRHARTGRVARPNRRAQTGRPNQQSLNGLNVLLLKHGNIARNPGGIHQ